MKKLDEFNNLKTPEELMIFMSNSIEYGCMDNEGNIYREDMDLIKSKLQLISISDMLGNRVGTCLEQVELERAFFTNNNHPLKTFAMKVYKDKELAEEDSVRIHCVLIFFNNDTPYIFEHSWEDYRGIAKFESIEAIFAHLVSRYETWTEVLEKGYKYYKIIEYDKPPLGINFAELKEFLNLYPPVVIGEINKNNKSITV